MLYIEADVTMTYGRFKLNWKIGSKINTTCVEHTLIIGGKHVRIL